jgi:hypothetical protein
MRFAAQAKVTKSRKAPRTQRITEIRARRNLRRFAGTVQFAAADKEVNKTVKIGELRQLHGGN